MALPANVIPIREWTATKYFWGSAVSEKWSGKVLKIYIDRIEIDVTDKKVILHNNGIEFIYTGEGK